MMRRPTWVGHVVSGINQKEGGGRDHHVVSPKVLRQALLLYAYFPRTHAGWVAWT